MVKDKTSPRPSPRLPAVVRAARDIFRITAKIDLSEVVTGADATQASKSLRDIFAKIADFIEMGKDDNDELLVRLRDAGPASIPNLLANIAIGDNIDPYIRQLADSLKLNERNVFDVASAAIEKVASEKGLGLLALSTDTQTIRTKVEPVDGNKLIAQGYLTPDDEDPRGNLARWNTMAERHEQLGHQAQEFYDITRDVARLFKRHVERYIAARTTRAG